MKRSLKIGISCYPSAGGSGIIASELGLALADRGHEIHFISSAVPFRVRGFRDKVCVHRVETMDYPLFDHPPYTLALAVKMQHVASYHGLDLLHVHYAIPHAASAILASQMSSKRIPIVTTLHGTDITLVGNHPSYHRVTRFCIEESDRVTAPSTFLAEETHKIFKTEKHIETIPNFVDTDAFRNVRNAELRANFAREDETILLHASNFRPVKRAPWVVDIFAGLAEKENTVLLMAGDGPDLAKSEYKVRQLGLENRVRFLGAWEAMEELLPLADIYLQPSEHESFGLAALEAMSAGVPVMITSAGGPGEFVRHGENGFLLDPEDLEAWVNCADSLIADAALRKRISLTARATAVEKFSQPTITNRYEDLFEELVESARD